MSTTRLRATAWLATIVFVALAAAAPIWLVNLFTDYGRASWWRQAAFGVVGLRLLALLVGCVEAWWIVIAVMGSIANRRVVAADASTIRLSPLRGSQTRANRDRGLAPPATDCRPFAATKRVAGGASRANDEGTVIIEFALLFPIALLLFLVILQTALLYVGNFYVNFAAFRAARAAIVYAGIDAQPETATHTLVLGPEAMRRMTNAAVFTCAGISGTSTGGGSGAGISVAQADVWRQFIGRPLGWMGGRIARRFDYAAAHTRVRAITMPRPDPDLSIWNAQHADFYRYREPITVEVTHDFELAVPYAKAVLGGIAGGAGDYRYTELRAGYTLVNEGQPLWNYGGPVDPVVQVTPPT